MNILPLVGKTILPYIPDLARLRIEVFRAYPYLYDGSLEYEERYLSAYANSDESLFALALDGDDVVGVSTGIPLADEGESFRRPFEAAGIDPERVFYFGESVLLEPYRGSGVGRRFMQERERYARMLDRFDWCAFCAISRPENHPSRPIGYSPLDLFWRSCGFERQDSMRTTFSWKEVGEDAESEKEMVFWLKRLRDD